ncbi:MAG: hypothetical protein LBI69_03135 [Puniceicoccales bacterium]|jgi:hypothetical protein|nr:hypothetical protein [Puniceicoccales bacterium]
MVGNKDLNQQNGMTSANDRKLAGAGKGGAPEIGKIDGLGADNVTDKLSFKDSLTILKRVAITIACPILSGGLGTLVTLLAMHYALGSIVLWGVILVGTGGALIGLGAAFYWMFLSYSPLPEKFNAPEIAANIVSVCNAMQRVANALKTSEGGNFSAANDALMELFDAINDFASHSDTERFGLSKNVSKMLQIDGDNAQGALQCLKNVESRFAVLRDAAKIDRRTIEAAHRSEIEFMGTLQPKEVSSEAWQILYERELMQMISAAESAEPGKKYETFLLCIIHAANSCGEINSMQGMKFLNLLRKSCRNHSLIFTNKKNFNYIHPFALKLDCDVFLCALSCINDQESSTLLWSMLYLQFALNVMDAYLCPLHSGIAALTDGGSKINLPPDALNLLDLSIAVASNENEKAKEIDDIVGKLQDKYRENEDRYLCDLIESLRKDEKDFSKCLADFKELNDNPFNPQMRKNITDLAELIDGIKANRKGSNCDSPVDALKCKMREAIDCIADGESSETAKSIKNLFTTIEFCTEDKLDEALDAAGQCLQSMISEYFRGIKCKYEKFDKKLDELEDLLGKINMLLATARGQL